MLIIFIVDNAHHQNKKDNNDSKQSEMKNKSTVIRGRGKIQKKLIHVESVESSESDVKEFTPFIYKMFTDLLMMVTIDHYQNLQSQI